MKTPKIDPTAYIDPAAVIIGDVEVGANSSVWPTAVLRAEVEQVRVGRNTNIQDGCVVHFDYGFPTTIGDNVTIGHRAVIHGATIDDDCLIGMGAIVLNGAKIGAGSVVAAGSVVTEKSEFPPKSLIVGTPARRLKDVPPALQERMAKNISDYADLVASNRSGDAARFTPPSR